MEEIRYLLNADKFTQLINYCEDCLEILIGLHSGSDEDEDSVQKMEVTKNFLVIVAEKFVKDFQLSALNYSIDEQAVQDLKEDLDSDVYTVTQAILTCAADIIVGILDEIEERKGFEEYETKRDEVAEREILTLVHHFSENPEHFAVEHHVKETIPNMMYKVGQLKEQYINSGWYHEMGLRDYVESLAEDDPIFWGWLFDNPAYNGLLPWQLTQEQRKSFQDFLTFFE